MKTLYKHKPAEVWQIRRYSPQPDWVQEAFAKRYLVWKDKHLLILMAGLQSSTLTNLKLGAVGTAGGGFAGYGIYTLGFEGDVLDITNHQVVSARTFHKKIPHHRRRGDIMMNTPVHSTGIDVFRISKDKPPMCFYLCLS